MRNDTIEAKRILTEVQGKATLAEEHAKEARTNYDHHVTVLQQEIKEEVTKAGERIKTL